jgi:C-22 sterol desaturase
VTHTTANNSKLTAFISFFRKINCALSCCTLFSDYISQDAVKRIANNFYLVTAALELVNIPLSMYILFTKP